MDNVRIKADANLVLLFASCYANSVNVSGADCTQHKVNAKLLGKV